MRDESPFEREAEYQAGTAFCWHDFLGNIPKNSFLLPAIAL